MRQEDCPQQRIVYTQHGHGLTRCKSAVGGPPFKSIKRQPLANGKGKAEGLHGGVEAKRRPRAQVRVTGGNGNPLAEL